MAAYRTIDRVRMAAYRTIEVTLVSATDLKDVNFFSKMHVYATVSIVGEPRSRRHTPTDKNGGKNPSWNATFRFLVPVDPAAARFLLLHVILRAERTLGDRDVGEVCIPLMEVLVEGGGNPSSSSSGPQFVSYQIGNTRSGKPQGVLNVSYKFPDSPAAAAVRMAAYRTIEVTLVSATDLKDVNFFSKMHVYAKFSIVGEPRSLRRTPTDKNGGKNPSWNATFRFLVPVDPAAARFLLLHVILRAESTLGDRDVGEVCIPLMEVLVEGGGNPSWSSSSPKIVSYQIGNTWSGKPQGVLNVSYKFPDSAAAAADHAPAVPTPAGYPAPGTYPKPANPVTVKPVPRSSGLEYATTGNDSLANPPPSHARDGYGAGMDAGLLAGAIGGLLIGEMVSDAASYAGGFGDGGSCDL